MKKTLWLVILITLVAFILRVYRLDFVSLRGDESFTVIFVQRTWEGLWRGIRFIEPNPPLYYLLLRAWVAVAGASEFATRYFSVFFGVLCVPLLYRLVCEMFTLFPSRLLSTQNGNNGNWRSVALFAAMLIAINPYQIWHSQDVRNYTLWPSLSLAALIFFWRWWRLEIGSWKLEVGNRTSQARSPYFSIVILNLLFYFLFTAASLYTHYYDTFILIAENAFVFLFAVLARRWKTVARWAIAQVALVLVYAPWVLFGTNRVATYGEGSAYGGVPLWEQFSRTIATFVVSDTVPDALKTIVWLPLALALVAILISVARHDRARAAFLFLWIAIPTLALFAISIGRPLFLERYLNAIAPAYYLVFAIGLAQIIKYRLPITKLVYAAGVIFFLATSAFALANYYCDPAYAKAPDWRALAQFIAARQQPGDIVIQNFTEMSAIYYQRGSAPVMTLPKDFQPTPDDAKTLRRVMTEYRRIWFIPAQPDWWDPDHVIENLISRYADRELETRISVFRPQLYLTLREFEPKIIPINARLGNATLVGYRIEGARNLHVVLYWRVAQKIATDLTVFAHLADANERVVAQQDSAPVRGTYPTSAWQPGELIVDAYDLQVDAMGTFTILVGMYDSATLARVPVFDANNVRQPNDRVTLTQITISQ
ncbi:MAG: hypothetical protein HY868_22710 [Chloroflexi bacterium]|nr:hypothetical protein [Chloroflexota bacterium]